MIDSKNLKQLNMAGIYLVQLLCSVLHEKQIPDLPSELSWEHVFHMAKMHSVEVMSFYGAEAFIKSNEQLYHIWKRRLDTNLIQNLIQSETCKEIFSSLYKSDIRFLPLKGFEIKRLYKRPEFRQMSDIDILIEPQKAPQIKILMEKLGFQFIEGGIPYHDEYHNPPFLTIEFHKQMLPDDNPKWEYYKDIWKKALPNKEIPGGYILSLEDVYIYQIVHLWKHYYEFGSGIRSIMDIYIYLEKFSSKMDWYYIKQELKKLDLYDFSNTVEALSKYWFSDCDREKWIRVNGVAALEKNTLFSGTYGSKFAKRITEMDKLQVEKGNLQKIKYLFKRVFISKKQLERPYPLLKKYPALLPIIWIYRLVNTILHEKSTVQKEIELFKIRSKDN